MKKILIMTILSLFLFSGCTKEPQIVFKDKIVCVEQQKLEDIPFANIRVYKDDIELAKSYTQTVRESLDFYENQVDRNNRLCQNKTH